MTRSTIGGRLDLEALSRLYRPHHRDAMRAAAVELRQRGLRPLDIARALELTETTVRQLLGETPPHHTATLRDGIP